jgi:hypothetical protein
MHSPRRGSHDVTWFVVAAAAIAVLLVLLVTVYESGLQQGFAQGRAEAADQFAPSPFFRSTPLAR